MSPHVKAANNIGSQLQSFPYILAAAAAKSLQSYPTL